MSTAARKAALLALIEGDRQRRRAALLVAADKEAAAIRAQARAQARVRAREALDGARDRADAALAAAEARRQTRLRLARQDRASATLAAAWAMLPGELERRWRDPSARGGWLAHVIARAARELDGGAPWVLRHAPGATPAELAEATSSAPVAVECVADPDLRAGVRISRGGNVLDASLDGLLADRGAVAAAVLRALESAP